MRRYLRVLLCIMILVFSVGVFSVGVLAASTQVGVSANEKHSVSSKVTKKTLKLSKEAVKTKTTRELSSTTKQTITLSKNKTVRTLKIVITSTTVKTAYTKGSKTATVTTTVSTNTSTYTDTAEVYFWSHALSSSKYAKYTYERGGWSVVWEKSPNYSGMTDYYTRTIHINANLLSSDGDDVVITHELGHVLFFHSGLQNRSGLLQQAYTAEKSKYTKYDKIYITESALEFVAGIYEWYIKDNSWLKKNMPKSYSLIEGLLENQSLWYDSISGTSSYTKSSKTK